MSPGDLYPCSWTRVVESGGAWMLLAVSMARGLAGQLIDGIEQLDAAQIGGLIEPEVECPHVLGHSSATEQRIVGAAILGTWGS